MEHLRRVASKRKLIIAAKVITAYGVRMTVFYMNKPQTISKSD